MRVFFIKLICGREQRSSRALRIVGIHATILSILIAITSAYYISTQDKIHEMDMQVMREAEKINQLQFAMARYLPTADDFSKYDDPQKDVNYFWMLFSYKTQAQNRTPEMEIPKLPADRAEKAMKIMNLLVHRYPFPEAISLLDQRMVYLPPLPLKRLFKDRAEIAKWSEDLERVIDSMSMWPVEQRKIIDQYLQALKSRDEKLLAKWKTDDFLQVQGYVNPRSVFDNYIQMLRRAYEINHSVKSYLDKVKLLESRFVPKKLMLIVIYFTFFAFFCGVILPLFAGRVRPIFLLWIPCCFYIFAFSFLVYRLLV